MIARARRALPGMVVSLVLGGPMLVGQASAATEPAGDTGAKHPKAASTRKASKTVAAKSATAKPDTEVAAVRPQHMVGQNSRYRVVRPASAGGGRPIYRTSSPGGALIDDGTLWREAGNLATWQQTGVASWYGGARWQGRPTTSGARYDQNALTAAHATLPIGTRVRVTLNDNSSRFVIVTINDRPGTRTRIIDLSRQAAVELGIIQRGTAMVTLTPL